MFFLGALIAALFVSLSATAQVRSARENVQNPGSPAVLKSPWSTNITNTPPSYCHLPGATCLFYGGDLDPNSPNANGLANENDLIVSDARTYTPFVVQAGRIWTVTGALGNHLSTVTVIDPAQAKWEIRTGVSSGNGGVLLSSGTGSADYLATGRSAFGLTEYTVRVPISPPVVLTSGTYWVTVVPQCTNPNDSQCGSARYFLSDVTSSSAPNAKGLEPGNDSFFDSPYFGFTFYPTWGPSGVCGGVGCNGFSAGVMGTKQ
ncbi:MAG TPA: hypothetical protein VK639_18685 [Terriglobales bacterium]|nr:hypothetical protein [Terriglobales bacterium]